MRPPNAVGEDWTLSRVLRPIQLYPYEVITVTESTVESAHAACQAAVDATVGEPALNRMIEVIYEPGEYPSMWGGHAYTHSSTLDPNDVVIASGVTGSGVHHSYPTQGLLSVIEGITLKVLPTSDGGTGPKYPLHITGSGMSIWSNCIFDTPNTPDGGGATVGVDAGDGLSLHFYRCSFKNTGGNAFNIHGATDNTEGVQVCLVDCHAIDGTNPEVGYTALTDLSPDRLWVTGGNLVAGDVEGALAEVSPPGLWPVPVYGMDAKTNYQVTSMGGAS